METNTINSRRAWGDAKSLYGRRVEFTYGGSHEKVNTTICSTSQEEVAPDQYLYILGLLDPDDDDVFLMDDVTLTGEELSILKASGEVITGKGHLKLLEN